MRLSVEAGGAACRRPRRDKAVAGELSANPVGQSLEAKLRAGTVRERSPHRSPGVAFDGFRLEYF
jgi:hypothetical protein